MTHEFKQRRLEELLSTRMSDIREYAGLFEKVRDQGTVCALGNEGKIKNLLLISKIWSKCSIDPFRGICPIQAFFRQETLEFHPINGNLMTI